MWNSVDSWKCRSLPFLAEMVADELCHYDVETDESGTRRYTHTIDRHVASVVCVDVQELGAELILGRRATPGPLGRRFDPSLTGLRWYCSAQILHTEPEDHFCSLMGLAYPTTSASSRIVSVLKDGPFVGQQQMVNCLQHIGKSSRLGVCDELLHVARKYEQAAWELTPECEQPVRGYTCWRRFARLTCECRRVHMDPVEGPSLPNGSIFVTDIIMALKTEACPGVVLLFDHPLLLSFQGVFWRRFMMLIYTKAASYIMPCQILDPGKIMQLWKLYDLCYSNGGLNTAFVLKEHWKLGTSDYLTLRGQLDRVYEYHKIVLDDITDKLRTRLKMSPDAVVEFWNIVDDLFDIDDSHRGVVAELASIDKQHLAPALHLEESVMAFRFDTAKEPAETEEQAELRRELSGVTTRKLYMMFQQRFGDFPTTYSLSGLPPILAEILGRRLHEETGMGSSHPLGWTQLLTGLLNCKTGASAGQGGNSYRHGLQSCTLEWEWRRMNWILFGKSLLKQPADPQLMSPVLWLACGMRLIRMKSMSVVSTQKLVKQHHCLACSSLFHSACHFLSNVWLTMLLTTYSRSYMSSSDDC